MRRAGQTTRVAGFDFAVAAVATLAFVGLVTLVRPMTAADRQLLYWYQAPVGFAFVLFALDRWRARMTRPRRLWALDAVVVSLSLSRTLTWFLPLSGHALFLSYAGLSSRSWWVRGVAWAVLVEAIIIKHFWLNDDLTPWTGIAAGLLAAAVAVAAARWSPK